MMQAASSFQRVSVRDWNQWADSVTETLMLGFVPLDEGSAQGASAAFLDLCVKSGLLIETSDSCWELAPNALRRNLYCFGDRATVENCCAFSKTLHDPP